MRSCWRRSCSAPEHLKRRRTWRRASKGRKCRRQRTQTLLTDGADGGGDAYAVAVAVHCCSCCCFCSSAASVSALGISEKGGKKEKTVG